MFCSGDLSFAFCDQPFAVAAFIVFSDFGAFIVVAFGAIVTFFAFIETGAYALLRKLRSMSHNGFGRTSLCHMCRFISYCTTNTHSQCLRRHCMTDTYIHEACVARRNPISQAWFHTFDAIQHIFLDCRSPTRSCANACKPRNIHKHTGLMPIHVRLTSRLRSHTRTSSPTPLIQRSPFA